MCLRSLFLGQLTLFSLLKFGSTSLALGSQLTTTPVSADLIGTVVVVSFDGLHQLGEIGTIRVVDLGQGNSGACLAVHQSSETSLALDDAVWDAHFAAQGWQKEDNLQYKRLKQLKPS